MMGKDIGGKIRGAVFALVAGIVILYLVPINFAAADSLNRQFYPHCAIGSESVRNVHVTKVDAIGSATAATNIVGKVVSLKKGASGKCSLQAIPGVLTSAGTKAGDDATVNLRTDSGVDFNLEIKGAASSTQTATTAVDDLASTSTGYTDASAFTGAVWATPGEVMSRFQGINRLVTSILPVLITVGLFAVVGFGAAKMWRGGDMGSSIGVEVGIVIVVVVVMNLAPSMFDGIIEGATANAGQYGVTSQFSGITDLLFGLLPLLLVLSLIGLLAWRGYSGYKSFQGGGGSRVSDPMGGM